MNEQPPLPFDEWQEEMTEDVAIDDLDKAVEEFLEARTEYEEKKRISNEADAVCKEKKKKLYNLMQRAGKTSWEVDGLGRASSYETLTVPTLKSPEQKQDFAKWLESKYGKEQFWAMFNVNSMSLNAFYKQEVENDPSVEIPGLESPQAREQIRFTKKRSTK